MAQECNFGEFLERALRDRFICGLQNSAMQQRSLNDDAVDVFDMACGTALTMESTKTNLDIIHGGHGGAESAVNFVSFIYEKSQFIFWLGNHKENMTMSTTFFRLVNFIER